MKKLVPVLAVASALCLSTPAHALISDNFASAGSAGDAVVAEQIGDDGSLDGNCTGTAIGDYWVITARHCVENAPTPGGSIRIGQGDGQSRVKIDTWFTAPAGDVALIRTAEPLGLGSYPEVAGDLAAGTAVEAYGWSPDGSGKTEKLPVGRGEVAEVTDFALFEGKNALNVRLTDGSEFQAGDSGGPIFADGKVAGVLTASFNPDNPEAASSPEALFAPTGEVRDWITDTMAKEGAPSARASEESKNSPVLWWVIGGIIVIVAVFLLAAKARKQR